MASYLERRYGLALERVEEGEYAAAIALLETNLKEERHAVSMSLLGLALARTGRQLKRAEALCREAIELDKGAARHYLCLAEVCIAQCRREDAVEAVSLGLNIDPDNRDLVKLFNRLRSRKKPLFPFLGRSHPLNKFAGKLLANYRI